MKEVFTNEPFGATQCFCYLFCKNILYTKTDLPNNKRKEFTQMLVLIKSELHNFDNEFGSLQKIGALYPEICFGVSQQPKGLIINDPFNSKKLIGCTKDPKKFPFQYQIRLDKYKPYDHISVPQNLSDSFTSHDVIIFPYF